jgi:penicillin-binding protein 2
MEKLKNIALENKIFKNRVVIAVIFMIIITLIIILRLYNLQIINYDFYVEESTGNHISVLPIQPIRGKILDRNGKIIATNKLAYKLTLTPEKTKDINKTLLELKKDGFIDENNIKTFNKVRKSFKRFQNIPIKYNLSEEKVNKFLVSNKFVGVDIESYFHRVYPNDKYASHVVGYIAKISEKDKLIYDKKKYLGTNFVGKTGIEKQYETILHGDNGKKQIERNVTGRIINTKVIKPAKNGTDLYLSIDMELQKKALELLAGRRGAVVAIDVKNGEILLLASGPNYDPNLFVAGISHKDYQKLQKSKDIPLLNRAIQGLYPPGSTIKPMVALAGLEDEFIRKNTIIHCPGHYQLPNVKRKFNDWKRDGHGNVDVENAISQSCDVFFYVLADKMGIDTIHHNLKYFRFGEKTNIDIPGEIKGVLPSKAWKKAIKNEPWYRGETLNAGIGQGFISVTPLQLAVSTAAIANKGVVFEPKLLKNIQLTDEEIKEVKKGRKRQIPIKNIKNWEQVIKGMEQTIYSPKGTARRINKNLNYTLAGKTGTAQVFGLDAEEQYIAEELEEHLRDHALFTAFAPIEDPKIAMAVIIENAGSGSSKAAPIAKELLDLYFKNNTNN